LKIHLGGRQCLLLVLIYLLANSQLPASSRLQNCAHWLLKSLSIEPLERRDLLSGLSPLHLSGFAELHAQDIRGSFQTVAIIDSGITAHTDFAHLLVGGYDFADNDTDYSDSGPAAGPGTFVAGMIHDLAPEAEMVGLRVYDDTGTATWESLEQALQWVHDNRNSFNYPITTVVLSAQTAINVDTVPAWAMLEDELLQLSQDGIVVSAPSGNSFTSFDTPGLSYPAVSPYVFAGMSVDDGGALSFFSQRDQSAIASFGRDINSTVPDSLGDNNGIDDDYLQFSGTQFSAPFLAAASLLTREALLRGGFDTSGPSTMVDPLFADASLFSDPLTGQDYNRLDVQTTVENILADQNALPNDRPVAPNLVIVGDLNPPLSFNLIDLAQSQGLQITDPNGDLLSFSIYEWPAEGDLSLNAQTGDVLYDPNGVSGTKEWKYRVSDGRISTIGAVRMFVEAIPAPFADGDFNRDDVVDSLDLAFWGSAYGRNDPTSLLADTEATGTVSGFDFLAWQLSFGSEAAIPLQTAQADSVFYEQGTLSAPIEQSRAETIVSTALPFYSRPHTLSLEAWVLL